MMQLPRRTPEQLAEELLGRKFSELEQEEQNVLRRIAAGTLIGPDADEIAATHASRGDRLADRVASVGGSWGFIIAFGLVLIAWMLVNSHVLEAFGLHPFDGYPYIFLNLILSMLAAIQAPVIMMSQNRQADKDRIAARHDYEVNLRTQLEILRLHRRFDHLIEYLEARRASEAGEEY
ncbi:DUF1003 domain-containing protein [Novosphingobium pentaromativorans]|uniref:Cyclic nucleotide-binding protein n=1 Tax=Novosphingobium pentaromativorans US6-1 TaxID=1088721 RepID=G6EIJ5_9SPHN|nr:DUF1003 domain-containing protein [Novosphingobium pentaromativorans]AIT78817.1 membrane protein [Novosphingobium pentaromativorans US6-1]EHJ58937.1 hypothetical protein NSU_4166 [Novosphingobium pentaromativorans US6-1]